MKKLFASTLFIVILLLAIPFVQSATIQLTSNKGKDLKPEPKDEPKLDKPLEQPKA